MTRRERWNKLRNKDCGMPSFIALFPEESNSELYFINVIEKHPDGDRMLSALEDWHNNWIETNNRRDIAEMEKKGWDNVRKMRDDMLLRTDWSQISDAPIDTKTRKLYRDYRQYLRDVPKLFSRWEHVVIKTFAEYVKNPLR